MTRQILDLYNAAMKKKNQLPSEEEISKLRVHLPVVLGIQPIRYIVPLWASIVVLVLFALLVLPGLVSPGSHLRIESPVTGASVYVDGVRLGATPLDVYIPAGKHTLELRYRGMSAPVQDLDKSSQIFASIFSYARETVSVAMSLNDPEGYLAALVEDFSRWSLVPEKTIGYPVAPVVRPGMANYLAILPTDQLAAERDARLRPALLAMASHIANSPQLEDWYGAWELVEGTEAKAAAATLLAQAGLGRNQDLTEAIKTLLGELPTIATDAAVLPVARVTGQTSIAGRSFSTLILDKQTIYIDNNELDEAAFSLFLSERPEWSRDSLPTLLAGKRVEDSYLATLTATRPAASQAVRDVSRSAALAYCEWYTRRLPEAMRQAGYRATLPSLEAWRAVDAALQDQAGNGPWQAPDLPFGSAYQQASGVLRHWHGGLFEWSASAATSNQPLGTEALAARDRFPGFQFHLLGGGLSLLPDAWKATDAYAAPAERCAEVAGFRVWLMPGSSGN